jgi:trk system potassium uptake protein TrkA
MKIIVVGCDKIGTSVVELLTKEDHEVSVIDIDPMRVKRAFDKYEITGVVGNGASYDVQKKAGADKADLLIACTNSDEVNILCCMVARELGVQRTVLLNNNEQYYDQIDHLRKKYNIDFSVSPEKEAAAEVARMLRFPSALQVEIFADGRMELIDVILPEDSEFAGQTIAAKHGKMYPDVQICAVERDGETIIPSGNFVLESGDRLSLASTVPGILKYLKATKMYQSKIKRVAYTRRRKQLVLSGEKHNFGGNERHRNRTRYRTLQISQRGTA